MGDTIGFAGETSQFICGVVEGFYGRPWTSEQRKDLFRKLKKWGMDSYVYAPKDDYKHRAYWRELYTVEEADHLTSLIAAAKEHNIRFFYALSPGLDMTYSNPKELATLKRKLEQVSQFGCDSFALLFDDIESEMSKADKDVFQSFAQAQVSVTNEVYNHLNSPRFLFCPTQYCSSRAVPSVKNSEYLQTIGSTLIKSIDIMWTGSKVITKTLSIDGIREITEVLQRPPLIWDNLHANDYDPKRVFLGPYSGRSPEIIPLLRGVLTNPNCEFHANAIAIHTLASWSKCNIEAKLNHSMVADVKLETENEEGIFDEDTPLMELAKHVYHPKRALKNALIAWLPEFSIPKDVCGPLTKPHPPVTMVMPIIPIIPSINTCMSLTSTTVSTTTTSTIKEVNTTELQALADVCTSVAVEAPSAQPMMNSLVSETKVVTNESIPNPILSNVGHIPIPDKIPIMSIQIPIMSIKAESIDISKKLPAIKEFKELADKENDIVLKQSNELDSTKMSSTEILLKLNENIGLIKEKTDDHTIGMCEIAPVATSSRDNVTTFNDETSSVEPMDCGGTPLVGTSPKHVEIKSVVEDVVMSEVNSSSSGASMQIEGSDISLTSNDVGMDCEKPFDKEITIEDLYLLCDLFYLPFEHGNRAMHILQEFQWLKTNANVLLSQKKNLHFLNGTTKPEIQEWHKRSERFSNSSLSILNLAKKIALCANKELSYDLFTYVWDMAGVVTLLLAFVKWLELVQFPANINSYIDGNYTWFSKGWQETFTSGSQEPWVFRGGLTADLQRLIPVDAGNDLFLYKLPDEPTADFPTIRPYVHSDESDLYRICHNTCRDGSDCTELFPDNLQTIPADRLVGPFITINPEFCMIIQNVTNGLIGYACAALDAKAFYRKQEMCWIPAMCVKYPISLVNSGDITPAAAESINHFHNFKYDCPQEVLTTHPSIMACSILKDHMTADQSVGKRLVTVLLAALRANGSFGVHVCLNKTDRNMSQFYSKLGFVELYQDSINTRIYLGRNF